MRIPGATNFRPITSLRPVLFRSDHLGALDEDDAAQVRALGIRRVLDFRGVDERASAMCALPDVAVHSLAIEPTIVQTLQGLIAAGHTLTAAEMVAHMQDTYRGFVRHNSHRFAEFFGHLIASDEPTVFHCTAGKDRTGFAAALLLHALGADDDLVMQDYLETNARLQIPEVSRWGLPRESMLVLWRVQPEFLQAALDEAQVRHGSVDAYLRDALGVGDAQRERLGAMYFLGSGA